MTKKLIILLASLVLVVPFLFYGCTGDDGSDGAKGATGDTGPSGPAGPGTVSNESCTVCHGTGADFDVRVMHAMNVDGTKASMGSVKATIDNVTFGTPNVDNVPVSVTFTMAAKSANGSDITGNIDLRTAASNAATYLNFYVAKLVPGIPLPATSTHTPDNWFGYVLTPGATGSGPFSTSSLQNGGKITLVNDNLAGGKYTYTFPDNAVRVSGGYDNDLLTHRMGMQIYNLPAAAFWNPGFSQSLPAPFVNATKDLVPGGGTVLTRDVVTTAACESCHDPLGFHSGGARYDTKVCVICHASNIASGQAGWDNAYMVTFIHGIHSASNLGTAPGRGGRIESLDFSEVTYPQSVKNCTTCHTGGTDSDNWKNVPSREACSSCHVHAATFSASGSHATRLDAGCSGCHSPTGGTVTSSPKSTTVAHADNTLTPTNVPPGLATFKYEIASVTMDNATRRPVVKFRILKDNTAVTLNPYTGDNTAASKRAFVVGTENSSLLTGFTGSPSFLVAFSAAQDGVSTPADYNNKGVTGTGTGSAGKTYGQPATVSIAELQTKDGGSMTGPDNTYYTATLAAQVTRAATDCTVTGVKTGDITATYNAAYPAGATMKAVGMQGYFTQGGVRRPTPSIVAKVTGETVVRREVVSSAKCLECHEQLAIHGSNRVNNVQLCVICHNTSNVDRGGPWNMKEMVHGIHSAVFKSGNQDFTEVTYPGELSHCTKCHYGPTIQDGTPQVANSYKANLPANVLLTTMPGGTGFAATDQVNSPTASACYYCHFTSTAASHFVLQGGDIQSLRSTALLDAPWDVTVTP